MCIGMLSCVLNEGQWVDASGVHVDEVLLADVCLVSPW
jgi:hypothetical protein